jgi:hypothetical protein
LADEKDLTLTRTMGVKRVGIQGLREKAREALKDINPEACAHRFAIGFDDSGSMGTEPIKDAKRAVAGFLGACDPKDTSVAIVPFSGVENKNYGVKAQALTNNYTLINAYLGPVKSTSGTPLYGTINEILTDFKITRGILFSDGGSTDKTVGSNWGYFDNDDPDKPPDVTITEEPAVIKAIEMKIPFDCVAIGLDSEELKHIAKVTGGVYIHFTDTTSFAKNMKYLSPKYIALLSNAELKAKIERGEQI